MRNANTRLLVEAETMYRETLVIPTPPGGIRFDAVPICYCQVLDFKKKTGGTLAQPILAELAQPRECDSYTPWIQGFDPKEHRELLDRKFERQWQEQRIEQDLVWREQQAREDKEWREAQEQLSAKRHRWELIIMGGVVTLVSAFVQIIAAYISKD